MPPRVDSAPTDKLEMLVYLFIVLKFVALGAIRDGVSTYDPVLAGTAAESQFANGVIGGVDTANDYTNSLFESAPFYDSTIGSDFENLEQGVDTSLQSTQDMVQGINDQANSNESQFIGVEQATADQVTSMFDSTVDGTSDALDGVETQVNNGTSQLSAGLDAAGSSFSNTTDAAIENINATISGNSTAKAHRLNRRFL